MHRRKDIFGPDADDFKPERWETQDIPAWAFLPFNGGPRVCLGRMSFRKASPDALHNANSTCIPEQFALTEISYIVVRLLQDFKHIESRDPEPWKDELTLTYKNANGAKVAFSVA